MSKSYHEIIYKIHFILGESFLPILIILLFTNRSAPSYDVEIMTYHNYELFCRRNYFEYYKKPKKSSEILN